MNNNIDTKATTTTVNTKQDKIILGTASTESQILFNITISNLKKLESNFLIKKNLLKNFILFKKFQTFLSLNQAPIK